MNKSTRLTESAIMVALAFLLSMLKVLDMPFGGTVTACSMLPIAIIAYRHGMAWGLLTGFSYSLLQLIMGMKNLTYATSAAAVVAIIMLDYILAFTVIGLAGSLRKTINDRGTSLALGAFLVCVLRYLFHVVSGCTVWAGVSIPSSDGLIFSLAYNAAYMVPETVLTVAAAYFAGKAFTLTEPQIKRIPVDKKEMVGLYSLIPFLAGITISFTMIFSMMQTSDGFDISAMMDADAYKWISVLAVFCVGTIAIPIVRASLTKLVKMEK